MDCLEGMKLIDDKSIDMILCDLPYGMTQCNWDTPIDLEELWKQYKRIIKDDGAIALFGTEVFSAKLILSNQKWYRYKWIWEKAKATGFLNANRRPLVAHEEILIFSKKAPKYYPQMRNGKPYDKGLRKEQTQNDIYGKYEQTEVKNEDGKRYPRSVIYFKTAEAEGPVYHKTQKPVALCEYLIKTYTNEGDLVLDNCMGSGTTAIACLNTNRNYIGFEIEKEYIDIINKRIEEHKSLG